MGDGHSGVFGWQQISTLEEFANTLAQINDQLEFIGLKFFLRRGIKGKILRG
jgi:hypothetical protein